MDLNHHNISVDLEQINEKTSDSASDLILITLSSLFSLSCRLSHFNSSLLFLYHTSPTTLPSLSPQLLSLTSQLLTLNS
ncbi:MAG: hypothetical protein [Microvirus sp.]|nr:MAG: hypothetical protein [Microvirus sp.]